MFGLEFHRIIIKHLHGVPPTRNIAQHVLGGVTSKCEHSRRRFWCSLPSKWQNFHQPPILFDCYFKVQVEMDVDEGEIGVSEPQRLLGIPQTAVSSEGACTCAEALRAGEGSFRGGGGLFFLLGQISSE